MGLFPLTPVIHKMRPFSLRKLRPLRRKVILEDRSLTYLSFFEAQRWKKAAIRLRKRSARSVLHAI